MDHARRGASMACALAVVLLCSCASWVGERRPVACGPPEFPYAQGWLGGDAAFSVPLEGDRSVWLFGDTFVGSPGQSDRVGAHFVHNTIAISTCPRDGTWQIDYAWGRDDEGTPRAFFRAPDASGYWWPFDGFVHAGALYVGLLGVEASEPTGPLNLAFRFTGMHLARVDNPADPPERWHIEVLPLSDTRDVFPGSAMVVHGEHVYLFAFVAREGGGLPRILARIPLAALDARPIDHLEYLDRDRRWASGLDPDAALVVMDDDATEMSVAFHPELDRWVAIYNFPSVGPDFPNTPPSDRVYMRTAERLEGPWSGRGSIFRIPELDADYVLGRDPGTFCYAAKEHPQYARPGRLLITYVCNLFTPAGAAELEVLGRLTQTMRLYRPIPVSIPLPEP